jgi:superfamily II DNA or RNA helicase
LKAIKSILDKRRPILGLTATPYRRDDRETRTLRKFFHSETYNISFAQLVTQRFLAWPVFVHWRMNSTKSFTLTELENLQLQRSGDYSAKTLERLGRIHNRDAEIARHFRTNAAVYKKTIAFACSIEHAEQLAKVLSHHRVSAKPIHSDLSTDARTSILNEFRSGSIQVLVNVGLLTEGTNVPETTTVLLARPTRSRSLYMQMIGRAARGHRAVPGKEKFYVIDCVDNFYSNGFSGFSEEIYQELNEAQALPRRETHEEADPPHDLRVRTTPGVTEALLHLLALGFEPRAYHFWGELQWTSPSTGARRGACVFLETRDLIKRAIQRLDVVRATGRQDLVEADARELDESGALRRDDWLDAWAGYRDRQVLPVLVEAADITAEAGVMSLVERIDQAVIVHPDWTLQEWQAYLDQQDDFREALLRAFGDLPSALQALLRHGHDRAESESPEEIHPTIQTRSFVQDAEDFTLLACALLAPSNVPAPETQIIRHSCDAHACPDSVGPLDFT